jgi:excisionase family DNA binding protein
MDSTTNDLLAGFLTPEEFGTALGVRTGTVLSWVRAGQVPAVKLGRRVLIPADALQRLVDRQEVRDGR